MNFITVQDLLYFAKTQLGVKWYVQSIVVQTLLADVMACRNMYSSEKVLQMSYANYQSVILSFYMRRHSRSRHR